VKQKKDGIFISQDKYVAEILRKFGMTKRKSASTPIDTENPLLKDPDGKDVDVHTYRSMIGSLMYLTLSRPNIMFAVCACARFQVTPKASHIHAVKRIFRYLKGKPHLCLWYPKDSPFDLVAYSNSDYAGASLDRKSTTEGCQFLGCRLISWQCKKQTVIVTSSIKAEYIDQLGDLSTHTTKYISPALTQKVFANMRRVGKGCSGVETSLFEGMLVVREIEEQDDAEEQDNVDDAAQEAATAVSGDDEALDVCDALTRRVEHLKHDKVAQDLEITKVKTRVKKLERANKVKALKLRRLKKVGTSQRIESSDDIDIDDASNQGRMIDELDRDTGIALMVDEGTKKKVEDAQVAGDEQEAVEVVTTAKQITEVVAAVSESVSTASATIAVVPAATITAAPVRVAAASTRRRKRVVIRDPEEESTAKTPAKTKSKDKGKGTMVEEPKPMKKKQQVEMDKEYANKLHEELNQDIEWDVAINHVKQKAKEDPYVQRYQVMKKKPQTEAQARRNMIIYLKNVAGLRLDYFKGMSYDD
nr:uncharacterized mitochondrial protein AtMg00810-like [Tanacetum cinerariifolium]